MPWSPSSWRIMPAAQQPCYDDDAEVERTLAEVRELPPLVFSGEVENLKAQLAEAAAGRRFVLQGGDCAERFCDCTSAAIVRKLKILLQMGLVMTYGARKPVIRLGRIAGQFAKPRSQAVEDVDGVQLPTYRGDNINGVEASAEARRPAPWRLLRSYFHSAATLNFIRALVDGGFADLRRPEHWQLDWVCDSEQRHAYQDVADRIRDAIDYIDCMDGSGLHESVLGQVEFFTSHEGLVLGYEEAHTRRPPRRERYYNLGAHFLWIGDRTRQLDGAHVEYFRGIANPVGVKVGPGLGADELVRLCERLSPEREPGRITLITRFGCGRIHDHLPPLIRAVKANGIAVLWSCDPMHGNTRRHGALKTRDFDAILAELEAAFEIHRAEDSHLAGVHFELTGDNVTECIGGAQGLSGDDLLRCYESGCDPRLNYGQSLEMAFLIARMLSEGERGGASAQPVGEALE